MSQSNIKAGPLTIKAVVLTAVLVLVPVFNIPFWTIALRIIRGLSHAFTFPHMFLICSTAQAIILAFILWIIFWNSERLLVLRRRY